MSTNEATHTVGMWIDNYEGMYDRKNTLVEEADSIDELAYTLQAWIEDSNPLADKASMFNDLLTHALQQVDWRDLAETYWEDKEQEDEEENEDTETCDGCGDSEEEDDTLAYRPEYRVKLCNVCFRTRELMEKGDEA